MCVYCFFFSLSRACACNSCERTSSKSGAKILNNYELAKSYDFFSLGRRNYAHEFRNNEQ